jgi:hypothetical protein
VSLFRIGLRAELEDPGHRQAEAVAIIRRLTAAKAGALRLRCTARETSHGEHQQRWLNTPDDDGACPRTSTAVVPARLSAGLRFNWLSRRGQFAT